MRTWNEAIAFAHHVARTHPRDLPEDQAKVFWSREAKYENQVFVTVDADGNPYKVGRDSFG